MTRDIGWKASREKSICFLAFILASFLRSSGLRSRAKSDSVHSDDKWKDGNDTLRFSLLAFNVKMTWINRRENPPWEIRETHPRKKKLGTYVKDKLVEVWERYSRPWTIPFLANHYLLIRESTASILMMTEVLVRGWKGDNFRLSSHRAILRMGRKADTVMIRRRKVKSMFLSISFCCKFRFHWKGVEI